MKPDIRYMKPDIRQMKRDIRQMKPDIRQMKPNIWQVKPDIWKIKTGYIRKSANIRRIGKMGKKEEIFTLPLCKNIIFWANIDPWLPVVLHVDVNLAPLRLLHQFGRYRT